MMFESVGQAGVFLAMMYAGLLIGLVYDGLRMLRLLLHAGRLLTALLDLLFWLGAGAVVAAALALRSEGALRLYALGGCAAGVVIYLLGISRVLRAAGQALARAYRRVEESPKWQARLEKQRRRQEAERARKQAAQEAEKAARELRRAQKQSKRAKS